MYMYSVVHLHVAQLGLEPCIPYTLKFSQGFLFREIVAP